ncbi:MAG: PleD family two-component system response regulator [Myxococcaceae bacterium]
MAYRVLLLEDDAHAREQLAARLLARVDVELVSLGSGFEALRLLPRQRFDLVLADVDVPDIDGLELINFIKKSPRYKGTPLLMLCSGADTGRAERGLALGATENLERMAVDEIVSRVEFHLQGRTPRPIEDSSGERRIPVPDETLVEAAVMLADRAS